MKRFTPRELEAIAELLRRYGWTVIPPAPPDPPPDDDQETFAW